MTRTTTPSWVQNSVPVRRMVAHGLPNCDKRPKGTQGIIGEVAPVNFNPNDSIEHGAIHGVLTSCWPIRVQTKFYCFFCWSCACEWEPISPIDIGLKNVQEEKRDAPV